MSSSAEMTLGEFAERLGSSAPTPGGGALAALAGVLAAAQAEMVGQLTAGRPRFAAVEERIRHLIAQLRTARDELLALMQADTDAFTQVAAAYKLPRATEAGRAARNTAIQTALRAALVPPLRVMETASNVLLLTDELALIGNPSVASDAGCAALLGEAAVRAGALNVLANVVLLPDDEAMRQARAQAEALEQRATHLRDKTLATVRERMGVSASAAPASPTERPS